MKYVLFTILFSFQTLIGHYGQAQNLQCNSKTPALNIFEALQVVCIANRDSAECKKLYLEIDKSSDSKSDADYKKIKCDKFSIAKNYIPMPFNPDLAVACAMGAVVDPVLDLGKSIGEGAAMAVEGWGKTRDCDQSFEKKIAYINTFNLEVPKLLRIPIPLNEKMKSMSCNQVQVLILNHRSTKMSYLSRSVSDKSISRSQKNLLTNDEKDFLNYINPKNPPKASGVGISELVEKMLADLKIKNQCYSAEQNAKLRCEIASFIASAAIPGMLVLRANRLAKISGAPVEEILALIQKAERSTASLGGKIVNDTDKANILKLAGKLSDKERVAVFEKLIGRNLSPEEASQLLKMHEVGSAEGRGFNELTKEDFLKKKKLAQAINPETINSKNIDSVTGFVGKPFFTNEEIKIAMRNGITGIPGKEDLRLNSSRMMATAFETQDAKKIEEGFAEGNKYYNEYSKLNDEKFKEALGVSSYFDDNAAVFFQSAVTQGLKPDEALTMAQRISKISGGDHTENLLGLSESLAKEATRLSGQKVQTFQNDFRQAMIAESRLKLESEAATVKYKDKYNEIDFDKFEATDPLGFERYQKLSQDVAKIRKDSAKKRWPHKLGQ